jgi:hypothetical protein
MLKQLLEPRDEVMTGRLQSVIDLERVTDSRRRALESRPRDFLACTYVSGEIRRLVEGLNKRLTSTEAETGLFLAEGPKGVGKSHDLVIPLHLVGSTAECQDWLTENDLTFSVPAGTRVMSRKFTDFPLDSLWSVIGQELGVTFSADQPPDINQLRAALEGKKLVVIFDELESGVRAISNEALRQKNINFLQMLSEESSRAGSNIALVASVYDGNIEPGFTLKRVQRVELRFQDSADRRKVLFHRLFKVSPAAPSAEIDAIINSYLNTWRRFNIDIPRDYPDHLRETFPFTPELLDVALVRIRSKGGFQGTRGSLGFLAALVRSRCNATHLITLADASLMDPEMRTWLADLDPSQNLITCAESNLRDLRANDFADQIASATLLASLAPSPKQPGITEDELARQVIAPGSDYNAFGISLTNFKKLGSFFHERAGSLFFDTKENAHSKVNLRAISVSDEEAWEKVTSWWANDVLRDPEVVVFSDPAGTQAKLNAATQSGIRVVVAPRRLKPEEIHGFYFGLKKRNTVVLVEPRDERVDLRNNADLLKYGKNWLAADYLARNAGDAAKSTEFSRIGNDERRYAVDYLKKTNFVHVHVITFGASGADSDFQRENLPPAPTREQITTHLTRALYPAPLLQDHLSARVNDIIGKKVSQVENEYRSTPGFPILMSQSIFEEAIRGLAELGTVVGIQHTKGRFCGQRCTLNSDELADALITAPFEVAPSSSTTPTATGGAAAGTATTQQTTGVTTTTTATNTTSAQPAAQPISTTFLPTRLEVRQQVATLLNEHEGRRVLSVRFALTYNERSAEVSTLPSFLRGSLSGPGKFAGEASLEFAGPFTKAQVEEMVERLPDFSPGACRVTLGLEVVSV